MFVVSLSKTPGHPRRSYPDIKRPQLLGDDGLGLQHLTARIEDPHGMHLVFFPSDLFQQCGREDAEAKIVFAAIAAAATAGLHTHTVPVTPGS